MVGELIKGKKDEWCPYHLAHPNEHIVKFGAGKKVWMYSGRSGDGPRLSSIIDRVRMLTNEILPVEVVWIACRELNVNKYTVQNKMVFAENDSPIQLS